MTVRTLSGSNRYFGDYILDKLRTRGHTGGMRSIPTIKPLATVGLVVGRMSGLLSVQSPFAAWQPAGTTDAADDFVDAGTQQWPQDAQEQHPEGGARVGNGSGDQGD